MRNLNNCVRRSCFWNVSGGRRQQNSPLEECTIMFVTLGPLQLCKANNQSTMWDHFESEIFPDEDGPSELTSNRGNRGNIKEFCTSSSNNRNENITWDLVLDFSSSAGDRCHRKLTIEISAYGRTSCVAVSSAAVFIFTLSLKEFAIQDVSIIMAGWLFLKLRTFFQPTK